MPINWDRKDKNLQDILDSYYLGTPARPTSWELALVNGSVSVSNSDATILASEVSGNGYARQSLTFNSTSISSGVGSMSINPVLVTATGGNIIYTHAVIIDSNDKVEMIADFGGTQTITEGLPHRFTPSFSIAG